MSMTDSDFAHGEYRTFRQVSHDRLLYEMVRSAKAKDSKASWKVLIMDKFTLKVMSYSCKMADITNEGVSLVEDLFKRRQPMPAMDAIYFIQPSKENVIMFLSDMSGRCPLYKTAYVFFSSPIPKELVAHIKMDTSVIPRIGALSEMNLEYFAIDSQGFITDHEMALGELYGENAEKSRKYNACFSIMATRIATAFASLKEFPYVRYRAAKSSSDASPTTALHDRVPSKLAAEVWNCISKYKTTIPDFPQKETCELLIVDRPIDQIAPVIHEWTYDAMCHDLLNLDGNKYVYEVPSKSGPSPEKKEAFLEDHDLVWLELRHTHIADASERLADKMANFKSKNKAAQLQQSSRDYGTSAFEQDDDKFEDGDGEVQIIFDGSIVKILANPCKSDCTPRDGNELSTSDLQKMIQALPQYSEQMEKLSLHVEIAGKINKMIRELGLRDIGQLEQDLVFGDAGAKEVINFLRTKQDTSPENKLRLLMIYAAVYPEKFEGDKGVKLMQLAKLSLDDMNTVNNMKYLGGLDAKKTSGGSFSLKFDAQKKKHAARKERADEEEQWQLSRFYPVIEELIEKLSKGELPADEYPCMNEPSPATPATSNSGSVRTSQPPSTKTNSAPAHSIRSRRTANWAKNNNSDDGSSSDSVLRHASGDFRKMGQRIFVFMIGGATRSELRVVHRLTSKLKREVILGSTSLDDPPQFITKLKLLKADDVSMSGLHI